MTGGLSSIEARLENWAIVMTGAPSRSRPDTVDAWNVERAWRALPRAQRDLLYWHYIKRAVREVICRKLSIPHRPTREFAYYLGAAQRAIASKLANTQDEVSKNASALRCPIITPVYI